ncbi:BNR repeat-containing protein [Halalkalicoccus tibetensis]|uniref:BNR repeat-containing protein n=1 Tax=Halalkalicoccus tibetensis TaxID=175632 RepID=A0ABD5V6X4_9EURY
MDAIQRRTFLATSGLISAAGVFGVGTTAARAGLDSGAGSQSALSRSVLTEAGLGNAQTDTPPFMPRLTTYNGRQYFAYWTHPGELVVAARDLPDGEWEQHGLGIEIDVRDGHWTPAIGVGPDGHLFLNYNTRDSEILWLRSQEPEEITDWSDEQIGMTGKYEESVTYVEFTRLQDGTLLEAHREGASGVGEWIMNRWDPDAKAWEPLQHPLVDGEGEFNSYMWNLIESSDGTLHYFFNFRETWDVETNVDLSYARSTDGGETWEHSDGTSYNLPITFGDTEVVDPIEPDSNFINQGWASYDPRNDAPHVTYYRDDEDGYTQIYHAYRDLDAEAWVTESATSREDDVNLGGGGVVSSPIGRMGIVVGNDGDVHILTRDFEQGGWPLLVEKLDGEWQTSVLYRRNMTWSDIHIDRERWRTDRVLSFVDHQQNVGDVPWSAESLLSVTDVDPAQLDRTDRTVEQTDFEPDAGDLTTYASTALADAPATTTSTEFVDVSAALALTETTVPASPVYARATVDLETTEDATEAAARVVVHGKHGTTTGDPVVHSGGDDPETLTTKWVRIPQAMRAGYATLEFRSESDESIARIGDTTLEVAYRDPLPHGETVSPSPSGGTEKPLPHMVTVDTTGLEETSPVATAIGKFEDTPTSLEIRRATAAAPLYARVTARIEPHEDADADAAVRLATTSANGKTTEYGEPVTVDDGPGLRTTGWQAVPSTFNGGTVTLQASNARITAATLELAIRNKI